MFVPLNPRGNFEKLEGLQSATQYSRIGGQDVVVLDDICMWVWRNHCLRLQQQSRSQSRDSSSSTLSQQQQQHHFDREGWASRNQIHLTQRAGYILHAPPTHTLRHRSIQMCAPPMTTPITLILLHHRDQRRERQLFASADRLRASLSFHRRPIGMWIVTTALVSVVAFIDRAGLTHTKILRAIHFRSF